MSRFHFNCIDVGTTRMRIISGQFRSRQLKGTPPAGLRPTSDKLRETLFNVLGPYVTGSDFLDACAGMGGVGIEAISRGAQSVYFVDASRKASSIIRENLSMLEVRDGFRILEMDLRKAIHGFQRDGSAFDVAFLDPPTIVKTCTLWLWKRLGPGLSLRKQVFSSWNIPNDTIRPRQADRCGDTGF